MKGPKRENIYFSIVTLHIVTLQGCSVKTSGRIISKHVTTVSSFTWPLQLMKSTNSPIKDMFFVSVATLTGHEEVNFPHAAV